MKLRYLLPLAVLALSGTLTTPANAQENGLKALLSGDATPLTRKLKEMDPSWRRLTIGGAPNEGNGMGNLAGGMMGLMFGGGRGGGGGSSPAYYTQGNTLTVGQETFLIAYRHNTKGLDFGSLIAAAGQGGPPKIPEPEKLTSDTDLALTLVNVRSIQVIAQVRTFNLDRELADAQKEFEAELTLRKSMEQGGPFGGGAVAIPEPVVEAVPGEAPKKATSPKPPAKAAPKKPGKK